MDGLCGFLEMKLATLNSAGRDGRLIVVNRALTRAEFADTTARTLQVALENWHAVFPALQSQYNALNNGQCNGFPLVVGELMAPLPRAYQWLDGSAYLSHVKRVRQARGAEMPPSFLQDPLMYQGGSDSFLAAEDTVYVAKQEWGIDFEAEIAVITGDVPLGISAGQAAQCIRLLMLVNDVSLRNLIPNELAKGFGFLNGKPSSAFSPVAVTPDELGDSWFDSKVHLPLYVTWNEKLCGQANAGVDMQFNFAELISHAAKTRRLTAGTILGSGTVSNNDLEKGYSCIVEKRVLEIIETGEAATEFMRFGDRVRIEMLDEKGTSIFGAIDQEVQICD